MMCLCLTRPALAAADLVQTQSALQLKQNGFKTCAHTVDDIANFVFRSDFSYLNQWNQTNVDKHSALVIGAKSYKVGKSVLTITSTQTQAGTCDTSFTLVMPFSETCEMLSKTTLKDWSFLSDKLDGDAVYEDPGKPTVSLVLEPFQGGCLAIKTGLFFLQRNE